MKNKKIILKSLLFAILTVVFGIIIIWISHLIDREIGFSRFESTEYCEDSSFFGFMVEPINSVTSLMMSFFGFLIILNKSKSLFLNGLFKNLLGFTMIGTGLTSGLFHALFFDWTRLADSLFVLFTALIPLIVLLSYILKIKFYNNIQNIKITVLAFLGSVALAFIAFNQKAIYYTIFTLSIFIIAVLVMKIVGLISNLRYFLFALLFIVIGYVFWNLDFQRVYCEPQSIFQLHALWHLFAGASFYCLYRFFDINFD